MKKSILSIVLLAAFVTTALAQTTLYLTASSYLYYGQANAGLVRYDTDGVLTAYRGALVYIGANAGYQTELQYAPDDFDEAKLHTNVSDGVLMSNQKGIGFISVSNQNQIAYLTVVDSNTPSYPTTVGGTMLASAVVLDIVGSVQFSLVKNLIYFSHRASDHSHCGIFSMEFQVAEPIVTLLAGGTCVNEAMGHNLYEPEGIWVDYENVTNGAENLIIADPVTNVIKQLLPLAGNEIEHFAGVPSYGCLTDQPQATATMNEPFAVSRVLDSLIWAERKNYGLRKLYNGMVTQILGPTNCGPSFLLKLGMTGMYYWDWDTLLVFENTTLRFLADTSPPAAPFLYGNPPAVTEAPATPVPPTPIPTTTTAEPPTTTAEPTTTTAEPTTTTAEPTTTTAEPTTTTAEPTTTTAEPTTTTSEPTTTTAEPTTTTAEPTTTTAEPTTTTAEPTTTTAEPTTTTAEPTTTTAEPTTTTAEPTTTTAEPTTTTAEPTTTTTEPTTTTVEPTAEPTTTGIVVKPTTTSVPVMTTGTPVTTTATPKEPVTTTTAVPPVVIETTTTPSPPTPPPYTGDYDVFHIQTTFANELDEVQNRKEELCAALAAGYDTDPSNINITKIYLASVVVEFFLSMPREDGQKRDNAPTLDTSKVSDKGFDLLYHHVLGRDEEGNGLQSLGIFFYCVLVIIIASIIGLVLWYTHSRKNKDKSLEKPQAVVRGGIVVMQLGEEGEEDSGKPAPEDDFLSIAIGGGGGPSGGSPLSSPPCQAEEPRVEEIGTLGSQQPVMILRRHDAGAGRKPSGPGSPQAALSGRGRLPGRSPTSSRSSSASSVSTASSASSSGRRGSGVGLPAQVVGPGRQIQSRRVRARPRVSGGAADDTPVDIYEQLTKDEHPDLF